MTLVTIPPKAAAISFTLPFPPKELSPNARLHHFTKASVTKAYRHECFIEAMVARRDLEKRGYRFPMNAPVTMVTTFVLNDKRRRDWTNLVASFKAGEDGIVDAGIVKDDSIQVVSKRTCEVVQGAEPAVLVRIEGAW